MPKTFQIWLRLVNSYNYHAHQTREIHQVLPHSVDFKARFSCNKGHVNIWYQHKFKGNLYVFGPVNIFPKFGTATMSHSSTRSIASTLASPVLLQEHISRICHERILPLSEFYLSTWNQLAVNQSLHFFVPYHGHIYGFCLKKVIVLSQNIGWNIDIWIKQTKITRKWKFKKVSALLPEMLLNNAIWIYKGNS